MKKTPLRFRRIQMNLKHCIKVNVSGSPGEEPQPIMRSAEGEIRLPRKLTQFLGQRIGVLVLVPETRHVRSVEVRADGEEGEG